MNDTPQLPGIAEEKKTGPVECLGMTFESDAASREAVAGLTKGKNVGKVRVVVE